MDQAPDPGPAVIAPPDRVVPLIPTHKASFEQSQILLEFNVHHSEERVLAAAAFEAKHPTMNAPVLVLVGANILWIVVAILLRMSVNRLKRETLFAPQSARWNRSLGPLFCILCEWFCAGWIAAGVLLWLLYCLSWFL